MGYFANGTEGKTYEHNVCSRCAHYPKEIDDPFCAVWEIHLLYNYDQDGPIEGILDALIPRQGVYNGLCAMFQPAKPEWAEHGENYKKWLEERTKQP